MSSKRKDACDELIEALYLLTGLPDGPFTILIEVMPVHHDDEDHSTSYNVQSVTVNEVFYRENEEDF